MMQKLSSDFCSESWHVSEKATLNNSKNMPALVVPDSVMHVTYRHQLIKSNEYRSVNIDQLSFNQNE